MEDLDNNVRRAVNEDFEATLSLDGLSCARVNNPWVSQCTFLLVFPEFRSNALGFHSVLSCWSSLSSGRMPLGSLCLPCWSSLSSGR